MDFKTILLRAWKQAITSSLGKAVLILLGVDIFLLCILFLPLLSGILIFLLLFWLAYLLTTGGKHE